MLVLVQCYEPRGAAQIPFSACQAQVLLSCLEGVETPGLNTSILDALPLQSLRLSLSTPYSGYKIPRRSKYSNNESLAQATLTIPYMAGLSPVARTETQSPHHIFSTVLGALGLV